MTLIKLSEEEACQYLSIPFNPPVINESLTQDQFFTEWHKAQSALKQVLDHFGDHGDYCQGDYYIGDIPALARNIGVLDRGIGVALTSLKMLSPQLLPSVASRLATLPESYEVELCFYTEDDAFRIFVTKNEIRAWCPDSMLKALGICE